jgi:hypothetical protein
LKQEDCKFEVSLGNIRRPYLKRKEKRERRGEGRKLRKKIVGNY